MSRPEQDQELDDQERIAVIGMAGRFPGAADVNALWRNVRAGVESLRRFTAAELEAEGIPAAVLADPHFIPVKGVLDDVETFDAEFFGFPPREAELLDPQQRLFLECAWQACESAGYDPQTYAGRIGVYAGAGYSSYMTQNLLANPERLAAADGLQLRLLNDKDFLATHVSYKLDLRGPSITVQTACSTSLVAAHLACQSLLEGECDMALAGGVTVSFPQRTGYLFTEGGILSSDGHCRAFDARADGTVEGNGAGAVLLKRLSDAVADGDTILAVIRGSAVNNDGANKAGYTAPSVEGQTRVVAEALAMAGVAADTIRYVETHGSGTPLGDPIEVEALTRAFRNASRAAGGTRRQGFCALGSIKTNLGHTDCAAGVAGLIKTVAALRHGEIPPSLGCEQPNPRLGLDSSPFYISTGLHDWPSDGTSPRRAGVNSLGIGGTNAHMVLEEAPPPVATSPSRPWQLLLLSARTPEALAAARANLAGYLAAAPPLPDLAPDLADIAHTLRVGRHAFRYRAAVVCRESSTAAEATAALNAPGVTDIDSESSGTGSAAFLFPGLGDHSVGMAAGLYKEEATFRRAIDATADLLAPRLGLDIREVLWPAGATAEATVTPSAPDLRRLLAQPAPEEADEATRRLNRTALAHPAVFAVEHALATLWMDWGLQPVAMIGYSLGEYVAACLAGVFSLADALELVALRARLIDALPPSAMLAVPLPAAEVEAAIQGLPDLWLAAANGPGLSVVSGTPDAVAGLERMLGARAVSCRRLQTGHGFHSPLMEPIVAELTRCAAGLTLSPPKIPFVSNVSGTWITNEEATDPAYWARHLCRPVRFAEGLETLLGGDPLLLIEAGPGQTLGTLVRQHPSRRPGQVVVASLRDRREEGSDQAFLLAALGRLWQSGASPRWNRFTAGERRRRVPLPTYPFERRRYFIEPADLKAVVVPSDPLARRAPDDWFSAPSWERSPLAVYAEREPSEPHRWLLLLESADPEALGSRLAARLEARGETVHRTVFSPSLDYRALLRDSAPDRIVHLLSLDPRPDFIQDMGFDSLLSLAQALGATERSTPAHLTVVTSGLFDVVGGETLQPEKAPLLGPCRVLPQEVRNVTCSVSDITADGDPADLAERLLAELLAPAPSPGSPAVVLALRGRHRWAQSFRPVRLPAAGTAPGRLRQGGVYLITDGLGETGLTLAEHLFRDFGARLALLAAPDAPARAEWAEWLGAHDAGEPLAKRLRRALALEAAGCELLVQPVDPARPDKVTAAVTLARERFGTLHGVVHAAAGEVAGMMQWMSREAAAAALAPAVRGTLALAAATGDIPLDFFALFGVNTLAIGGLGQVTSTAAGSFLAAFAAAREGRAPFTMAVGWDLFRWQPVNVADPTLAAALRAGIEKIGITAGELATEFERLLTAPFSQVVVATRDLATVASQLDPSAAAEGVKSEAAAAHPRPSLEVAYTAPESESERLIAKVWGEAFGIDEVGIHDNFFSLAGNSLLALQIVTRLSGTFGVDVPMASLLEAPTIAELAQRIDGLKAPAAEDGEMDLAEMERLLAEIEALSVAEAEALLAADIMSDPAIDPAIQGERP